MCICLLYYYSATIGNHFTLVLILTHFKFLDLNRWPCWLITVLNIFLSWYLNEHPCNVRLALSYQKHVFSYLTVTLMWRIFVTNTQHWYTLHRFWYSWGYRVIKFQDIEFHFILNAIKPLTNGAKKTILRFYKKTIKYGLKRLWGLNTKK